MNNSFEEDIDTSNLTCMSEEERQKLLMTMTPNAIPNISEMIFDINNLIEFVETQDMVNLEKLDKKKFEIVVSQKFNSKLPLKIITLLTEENRYDNLNNLLDMLDTLDNIKNGKKNMQEEYHKFSENLNEKYLYSKYGGKDNFEKVLNEKK